MGMQSIGTMIFWGNYYGALLAARVWILGTPVVVSIIMLIGFYMMSTGISAYPYRSRSRLARMQVKG